MRTERDFDRIARAWLDLMPSDAPDRAVESVLQAVAVAPQVRRWPRLRQWRFPVNRLTIIAATVALLAVAVGGAMLLTSGQQGLTSPTLVPSASASPVASPTAEPRVAFDDALRGLWVAQGAPIPNVTGADGRIQPGFSWNDGLELSVETSMVTGYQRFLSDSLAAGPGEFRIRARAPIDGCRQGDLGRYAWSRSTDGLFLTVSVIEDACAVRATTLNRTFVRLLGAVNDGGTGLAVIGEPFPNVLVTLPKRQWGMPAIPPVEISTFNDPGPARSFVMMFNPIGFVNACTRGGTQELIDPTTDAFTSYLTELPGFIDVRSTPVELDGRPAVHLTMSTSAEGCPDSSDVAILTHQLGAYGNGGPGVVSLGLGQPLSFWAIEVDGDLLAFWYTGDNVPESEERAVIDSIRFPAALPTP